MSISSPIWDRKQTTISTLLLPSPSSAILPPPPFPPNHTPFTDLEVSVLLFYFTCCSAVLDLAADESACADSLSSWEFRRLTQQSRQFSFISSIFLLFGLFLRFALLVSSIAIVLSYSFSLGLFFLFLGCLPVVQCLRLSLVFMCFSVMICVDFKLIQIGF